MPDSDNTREVWRSLANSHGTGNGRMGFTLMPRVESDRAIVTATLPYGTSFEKVQQADTSESVTSLRNSALAALLIIYALLAIPFRSYTQPILVMGPSRSAWWAPCWAIC